MTATSEAIKPAPLDEMPERVTFGDEGITDETAGAFADLLNLIESKPDKARRLNQAYGAMREIAEAPDEKRPYCSGCDALHSDAECPAADLLANAFATIEKYRDSMPTGIYNRMAEAMLDYYSLSEWQADPELLRQILPHMLRSAIEYHKHFVSE